MLIIGLDTEFTSLEDDESEIVEFGGVLYDTDRKLVLASFGKIYSVREWSDSAAECHGIPKEVSDGMPSIWASDLIDPADALELEKVDYIVAHNAGCDHPKVTKRWPRFLEKPWLCTQWDVKHEEVLRSVTSRKLGHLAVDYGILVTDWHRALADAEVCAKIAAFHDLNAAYERKMEPKFKLLSRGGMFDGQKEMFGTAPSVVDGVGGKYRWDGKEKCWWKDRLTKEYVEKDGLYIKKQTRGVKPKWSFELEEMEPPKY